MTRLLVLAVLLATASIATAQDARWRYAGTRGTVTAYELDGHTVIEHKTCVSSGRHSYDYVRCGNRLRDAVKYEMCKRNGRGTHHYMYQIGDGHPSRSSVYCR